MFKKSKRKIVAAIMSVLVLLYLGTLAVIYVSSYFEVSDSNHKMLKRYAELFSLEKQPGKELPPQSMKDTDEQIFAPNNPSFEDTPAFRLATFYSVAISHNGEILAMDNDGETMYEDSILQEYAAEIVKDNKDKGIKGNLLYIVAEKKGYTLVAFMDNTIMQQSMTTLFRYTIVFGSIMIIVLFFVAVCFANKIVKPIEESYQKQKQFVSDAGHELKTPISVVSANAELLAREVGDNIWLANIQYENKKMGNLVAQLLELARTENVSVQKEALDFSRIVVGEALPFESVAFEQGLILKCNIADKISVEGNSSQLRQIVSILLDNAIYHSENGKEVLLELKKEHGFARLSVINDGIEIPSEQKAEVFERFYRTDTARSGEDGHYGLGLAIAKAIIDAHKGKINVFCYDGKIEFAVHIPLTK